MISGLWLIRRVHLGVLVFRGRSIWGFVYWGVWAVLGEGGRGEEGVHARPHRGGALEG